MRKNTLLSRVLHVLLYIDMTGSDHAVTSEKLARAVNTNPVVVRRIMAGLRDHEYVRSVKGHGGGWSLACDLTKVTLRDIYVAVGCPSLIVTGHRTETPECRVEQTVNAVLGEALDAAEQILLTRLEQVTLAMLSDDLRKRLGTCTGTNTAPQLLEVGTQNE